MQTFNYHTHTARCGHATGDDEAYILAAIQAGFTTLGFSEHLGYEGWDDEKERIPFSCMQEYFHTMNLWKQKYQDQIQIRIGVEFEYFEDRLDYLKEIRSQCDYMIQGQHALQRGNDHYVHDHCSDEEVKRYADLLCMGMEQGLCDYIAHPDYFMLGRNDSSMACEAAISQIAQCAATHHIPIEVNLKGMKYGRIDTPYGPQYRYPHHRFFEIIASNGCDVVFGYDAHHPDQLLDRDRETKLQAEFASLSLHFISDLSL